MTPLPVIGGTQLYCQKCGDCMAICDCEGVGASCRCGFVSVACKFPDCHVRVPHLHPEFGGHVVISAKKKAKNHASKSFCVDCKSYCCDCH